MALGNRSGKSQKGIDMEEVVSVSSEMTRARIGRAPRLLVALVAVMAGLLALSAGAQAALPAELEVLGFEGGVRNADQSVNTDAGAHPDNLTTVFHFNQLPGEIPAEDTSEVVNELPPGVIGNALKMPKCRQEDMNQFGNCPRATQVGTALLELFLGGNAGFRAPVYNLYPPPGMPAQFGVVVLSTITHIDFSVRSDSDYGVNATIHKLNPAAPLNGSELTIWGVPGDPSHDALRPESETEAAEKAKYEAEHGEPFPVTPLPRTPLLTNPTSCGETLTTKISIYSWQRPSRAARASASDEGMKGCDQLEFSPTIEAKPTTNIADSPTGPRLQPPPPPERRPRRPRAGSTSRTPR